MDLLKSNTFRYLLIAVTFAATALLVRNVLLEGHDTKAYASEVQNVLHRSHDDFKEVVQSDLFQNFLSALSDSGFRSSNTTLNYLQNLHRKAYTILVYQGSELLYWSNNQAYFDGTLADVNGFIRLKNGTFYQSSLVINTPSDAFRISVLIPLKYNPAVESRSLHAYFPSNPYIPKYVEIRLNDQDTSPTHAAPITGIHTDKQATLYNPKPGKRPISILAFILLVVGILFGAFFIHSLCKQISVRTEPWAGAVVLLIVIFLVRWLSIAFDWHSHFDHFFLFKKTIHAPYLGETLGDLLINIALLLWIVLFFHKQFRFKSFRAYAPIVKIVLSAFNYLTIMLGLLMIVGIFRGLVLFSDFSFDLHKIFLLDFYSLVTLSSAVLILFILFLFTHKLMLNIMSIEVPLNLRFAALFIALACILPCILLSNLDLPALHLMVFFFFYIMLFDVFIDSDTRSFTWMVIWLVVFSAFSSIIIYKYSYDKELTLKRDYARILSQQHDSILEKKIVDFALENDSTVLIAGRLASNPYLINNYDLKIQRLDSFPSKYCEDVHSGTLYFCSLQDSRGEYILVTDSFQYVFKRQVRPFKNLYSLVYKNGDYRGLKFLGKFDFSVYHNGHLVETNSRIYSDKIDPTIAQNPGEYLVKKSTLREDIIYTADSGTIAVVGSRRIGFIKPLSLFSYIFSILIIVTIFFSLFNTFSNTFPDIFQMPVQRFPSLRNRIQVSVIAIIVLSFLIIGFVSAIYLKKSKKDFQTQYLISKSEALKQELTYISNTQGGGSKNWDRVIQRLAETHQADLDLYDAYGKLIQSSNPHFYANGLKAPYVNPVALHAFRKKSYSNYETQESLGRGFQFNAIYQALTSPNGQLLGVLGLPIHPQQTRFEEGDSLFMGTLLNVYVFLLILAGLITLLVSNSITRELNVIGQKLKDVKLGKLNEPLHWKNDDEIGSLVSEYNKMIATIEESASMLAKSEREGAWREMAKQVAHEIKNPLTPMKLSIQHLQRAYKDNPQEVGPLVERVTETLIKQIDNLAQIASEFSSFAKISVARSNDLDLVELLKSVYDLFEQNEDFRLMLNKPNEALIVKGNDNHLRQVFNNLINNAKQSFPENYNGIIKLHLKREGDFAMVMVEDNGLGIPVDMREKIFMPYFTTKHTGSGLGLAIAKNIIESMNGEISYETELNRGTTFFVRIPLETED